MEGLPRSVTIMGKKYKIIKRLPKKIQEQFQHLDLHGCFIPNDNLIYVNTKLPYESQLHTLIQLV